jgi:hypothetical protein
MIRQQAVSRRMNMPAKTKGWSGMRQSTAIRSDRIPLSSDDR